MPELPGFDLDPEIKKGIFIMFILAFGALAFLSLIDAAGVFGLWLDRVMTVVFGWGRWTFPLFLFGLGYVLFDDEHIEFGGARYIGLGLLALTAHSLLFLFVPPESWPAALDAGAGGGYLGWSLAGVLFKFLGPIAMWFVVFPLFLTSIFITFNLHPRLVFGREGLFGRLIAWIWTGIAWLFLGRRPKREEDEEEENEEENEEEQDEEPEEEPEEEESEEEGEDEEDVEDEPEEEAEEEEEEEDENDDEDDGEEAEPIPAPATFVVDNSFWWQKPTGIKIPVPLSLLDDERKTPSGGDIEDRKSVIHKALDNFGIKVEMGNIQVGPTVTQYTFRPAEGIKLSRVANLSNDLAMALAAHPIRIEAPIPNTHLVGVEVPNMIKANVGLREVLASKSYKTSTSPLTIALGKDVSGTPRTVAIDKMPHLLVAGSTNSGKSVCLNSIIVSMLYRNSPDDVRFLMIDPKKVELAMFKGLPHLLCPIITETAKATAALRWALTEMERRYAYFEEQGVVNIQMYNAQAKDKMPYLVIIIDELAELMFSAPKDIEPPIIRITQLGRAAGIHAIIATQRPSVNVITGLIKTNMPARVAFAVASSIDSRTILDSPGADKLLGRGDMLYIDSEHPKPVRLQGAFVSNQELKRVADYIRGKVKRTAYVDGVTEAPSLNGGGAYGGGNGGAEADELLPQAREVVWKHNKASTSLLQRMLNVGYGRAAKLLDIMQEQGIVGPPNGSKPREILTPRSEYQAMGVSGVALHRRAETPANDNILGEESDLPTIFKETEVGDEDEEGEEGGDDDKEDDDGDEGSEEEENSEEEEKTGEEGEDEEEGEESEEDESDGDEEEEGGEDDTEEETGEEEDEENKEDDDKEEEDEEEAAPLPKPTALDKNRRTIVNLDDSDRFFSR